MDEKRVDSYLVTRSIGIQKPLAPYGRRVYQEGEILAINPADRMADKAGVLTAWLGAHVADGTLVWQPEASGPVPAPAYVPSRAQRKYARRPASTSTARAGRASAAGAPGSLSTADVNAVAAVVVKALSKFNLGPLGSTAKGR